MGGRVGGRAHRRANEWTSGRAGHARRTSGRGRTMGGRADRRTGAGGRGRAERRISEGKTPDLTRQLIWLWEIQHGRPRVIVKLPHLPPPSR